MTWDKIANYLLGLVVVGIPTYAVLYAGLGMLGRVQAVLLAVPIISAVVAIMTGIHLYLVMMCNVFPVNLPKVLVSRDIPVTVVIPFLVFAGYLMRSIMTKTFFVKGTNKLIDRLMLATSIAVVAWVVVDRPSMASIGAETGGAWEAGLALSGVVAYWGVRSLRGRNYNWKRLMILTLCVSVAGLAITAAASRLRGASLLDMLSITFFSAGWWFYSLLLGVTVKVLYKPSRPFSFFPAFFVACLLFGHSLMSGFRSRILFGPLMIGSTFWSGKLNRSFLFFVILLVGVSVFIANSERLESRLPDRARRVLSPLKIGSQVPTVWIENDLGEMGIHSPWRISIWQEAWSKIREKPILGNGFAFSGATLRDDTTFASTLQEAVFIGVITAGQFHSVPINLMYYLGIPVAFCFCLAWYFLFRKLFSLAILSSGWYGALVVSLLSYLIAATGQALTTGLGIDFVAVCMVMGIYQAIAPETPKSAEAVSPDADEMKTSPARR